MLVSEFVTNVVVHARSDVRTTVHFDAHWVRVEVEDEGPSRPLLRPFSRDEAEGRGLGVVDKLATDWGTERPLGARRASLVTTYGRSPCPPLRPADFFCCVVPPCDAVLLEREPDPDFFPPRLDAPGEFAMRAALLVDPRSVTGRSMPC